MPRSVVDPYFPLATGFMAAVFTVLLAVQYVRRRRRHQLVWAVGVTLFSVASFLEFFAVLTGWSEPAYRVYLSITSPMVGLLGLGTLLLLADRSWGKWFAYYWVAASIAVVSVAALAPVDPAALPTAYGAEAMPTVRLVSPLLSVPGGILLIAGSAYSWWTDRSRRYGLVIAGGGLLQFLSGSLQRTLGLGPVFYSMNGLGFFLLFLGFLLTIDVVRTRVAQPSPAKA